MSSPWAPLLLLVFIAASDVWVYIDAQRASRAGMPVRLRVGALSIESPPAWLLACVVLWLFFFPAYLVSRRA